jgi:hypothetical protein
MTTSAVPSHRGDNPIDLGTGELIGSGFSGLGLHGLEFPGSRSKGAYVVLHAHDAGLASVPVFNELIN